MHPKVYLVFCVHIFLLDIVYSQTSNLPSVNCVDRQSNRRGLCSYYNNCRYAQSLYENQNITPTICGYIESQPVVCCPYSDEASTQRPSNNANSDSTYSQNNSNRNRYPTNQNSNNRGKTISAHKCDEYAKKVTRQVQFVTLTANPEVLSHRVSDCNYNSNALIVGGEETKIAEFPHMAALGWKNLDNSYIWICGGSLISENFVLTASHCTYDRSQPNPVPAIVRIGDHNLKSDIDRTQPQNFQISQIIKHPKYKITKYHDIALLRLATPAQFNKFVRPACLWQDDLNDNQRVVVTGWGKIGDYDETSDVLRKVSVNVINQDYCRTRFLNSNRKLPQGIVDEQLCAGVLEGGKDSCQGDSGGPLQLTKGNVCIFYIAGITSFGNSCAAQNSPGIYTKVSKYIPWIESIVWPSG